MYFSLIGDIISSRDIKNREEVQKKLNHYLEYLNNEYNEIVIKKMTSTIGDEFQGLFSSGRSLLEIVHKIEFEMYPIKLRFGIGIGDISFNNYNEETPFGSDGKVWWNARDAIENAKSLNNTNKLESFSSIQIMSSNAEYNERANTVLNLCQAIKEKWTIKQRELIQHTINEYGFFSKFSFKEVSQHFDQSMSTVFGKYQASKFSNYVSVMLMLAEEMEREGKNGNI